MGAFTLTNGALLGGLALLVAPVIAHLLQRRARKPIIFPSIAFLRSTAAQQSRLHKLKRLFLLLLRAIAIACVVLAFTRPVWWNASVRAGERAAATATVFLIDASLSTSQQAGAGTLFDRLKSDAVQKLDDLRPGVDLAGVVWAGDQTEAVFPRLTANLPELRNEVSTARPSEGRADFPTAISLAARLLESHNGPKRLVILTDRQISNWKPAGAADTTDLRRPSGIELVVPDIDWIVEPNVALTSPAMSPDRPRPAAIVDLTAAVRNSSDTTRVVNVSADWISAGGAQSIGGQSVSVSASQMAQIALQAAAPEIGFPTLRWQLKESDALAADNVAWLTASPGEGIPIVIASDDSPDDPGTAAFYLMRALAPFDDESESRSSFAPRHVSASRLTAADLENARVVFLGYSGVLKTNAAVALVEFVKRGGGLVVLAGDGPADRNVQLLDETAKGGLVSWRLLSRVEAPRRTPMVIERGNWNSRWLREFDEPSQLALREIAFRRTWSAGAAAAEAEVLLAFANGAPAMGLRHLDRGQCLLLNFSPEATTSDLGKTGTFVALMQMLTSLLAHDERDSSTFLVGDHLRFPVERDVSGIFTVINPEGESSPASGAAASGEIHAGRARRAGIYRLAVDGKEVSAAAVNVDPRESDLSRLSIAELTRLLGENGAGTSPQAGHSTAFTARTELDAGRPLWGGFLLGGLGALAMELLLLGLWRR